MAEKPTRKNVPGLNTSSPPAASKSPDSDVSPHTKTSSSSAAADYFSASSASSRPPKPSTGSKLSDPRAPDAASPPIAAAPSSGASTTTVTSSFNSTDEKTDTFPSRQASNDSSSDRLIITSRKSSTASVTFRPPRNPSLPQGVPRKTDNQRLRHSSPEPIKFRQHVGFDNLPAGEATKNNPSSLTLQARHQGYQSSRRSRTFMIGVDEHAYSDYALVWLLTHMVDDGDEVVCVRVVESGIQKNYQEEAKRLLRTIQSKNEHNKAISIILEYSVGKLHDTFQQLLGMYNPSMLVVGTKGRSLGGIQGLMNTRNSFSKYCLQYSPIPVVVVRPDDKRAKKKEKRTHDPSRQNYASMLAYNSGKHEADSETSSIYMEKGLSADEEAHRVAAAIGLPARFDPTIKPYTPTTNSRRSSPSGLPSPSAATTSVSTPSPAVRSTGSGDEDNGDDDNNEDESGDDEDEFEAVSGQQLLKETRKQTELVKEQEQKKRLHDMEVGEAAALLKSQQQLEDEEDDDESQERTSG